MTAYEHELSRVGEIDHALTEVQRQVDFLLNITPMNSNEAWLDFERSGFSTVPMLQSRPLGFEPDLIKRRLYDLESPGGFQSVEHFTGIDFAPAIIDALEQKSANA